MEVVLGIFLLIGVFNWGSYTQEIKQKPQNTEMSECAEICETGTVKQYKYCKCKNPNFGDDDD